MLTQTYTEKSPDILTHMQESVVSIQVTLGKFLEHPMPWPSPLFNIHHSRQHRHHHYHLYHIRHHIFHLKTLKPVTDNSSSKTRATTEGNKNSRHSTNKCPRAHNSSGHRKLYVGGTYIGILIMQTVFHYILSKTMEEVSSVNFLSKINQWRFLPTNKWYDDPCTSPSNFICGVQTHRRERKMLWVEISTDSLSHKRNLKLPINIGYKIVLILLYFTL